MKRQDLTCDLVVEMFQQDFGGHYQLNDHAHRQEHFRQVARDGISINDSLDLKQDPLLITIVAWVHDLFAWDRKNHHELSAEWVLLTEHPVINALSDEERLLVSQACREHRASWKGSYSSILSEVTASADRGFASTEDIFKRAFVYATHKDGLNESDAVRQTIQHLVEKFGRSGYMCSPRIYEEFFSAELEKRYKEIEMLKDTNPSLVIELFDLRSYHID